MARRRSRRPQKTRPKRARKKARVPAPVTANAPPSSASPCPWFLYAVECADGTLYVGIAKDVVKRVAVHNSGRGAKYTSRRRPVRLVYTEKCPDVGSALRREREVKRWSRPQKLERLGVEGPPRLAKRRRLARPSRRKSA